jgi:hypothetical protein
MKISLLTILLLLTIVSFAQIDKIGYTKSAIINYDSEPCKTDDNSIWYCGDNGGLVNYGFNSNNTVTSVLYMYLFDTKYLAELDVQSEIAKYSKIYGRPTMKGADAFWFSGNLLIMISYGFSNGKHYSCWRVSER